MWVSSNRHAASVFLAFGRPNPLFHLPLLAEACANILARLPAVDDTDILAASLQLLSSGEPGN
jgi:hypothetical protein